MRFLPSTPARAAAALAAAVALAGCSFITGIPSVSRVEVVISPRVINVSQGATAVGTAYHGSSIIRNSRRQVAFRSSNTTVATVNPSSGAIVGLSVGVAVITGESGGKSATDSIIVRLVPARSLVLLPSDPRFRVGITSSVGAVARDSANNVIVGRQIAYRSTNEAVLLVNATSGVVTPRAVGTADIIATVENGVGGGPSVSDTVSATVTPVPITGLQLTPLQATRTQGETQQYTLAITDSVNAPVTGRAITWLSTNPQIASIDANGLATAIAPGTTTISAVVDRIPGETARVQSGGVTLIVTATPAASVTVAPTTLSLKRTFPGPTSATVNLTVRDANGNQLVGRRVRITSSDNAVATPGASEITGTQVQIVSQGAGTATITFQALDSVDQPQGAPATVTVTVVP